MVEIHEPVRLLCVVETRPEVLAGVVARTPALARLVHHRWIQVAALAPDSNTIQVLGRDGFVVHTPATTELPRVPASADWYRGHREHLPPARIVGESAT
jgi:hypothetical protein